MFDWLFDRFGLVRQKHYMELVGRYNRLTAKYIQTKMALDDLADSLVDKPFQTRAEKLSEGFNETANSRD